MNGLRSYETGYWDGGDPTCDHKVRQDPHVESSTLSGGKATTGHQREGFKAQCPRCGAIRIDNQIGLEQTPQEFIAKIVAVFEEVRRVLKPTGVVFLNVGDSYAGSWGNYAPTGQGGQREKETERYERQAYSDKADWRPPTSYNLPGFKPKDRMLMPARIAIALQDAGWWVRSEIVWFKSNCMPSSAEDRPTDSHEMVYMLTKRSRYWSDFTAIREPAESKFTVKGGSILNDTGWTNGAGRNEHGNGKQAQLGKRQYTGFNERWDNREEPLLTRNVRSVWQIAPEPSNYQYCGNCNSLFKGNGRKSCPVCRQEKTWIDHFAAFPSRLVERCILAGCPAQVCSACGKPYERVVEETGHVNKREPAHAPNSGPTKVDSTGWAPTKAATNVWRPTCKCEIEHKWTVANGTVCEHCGVANFTEPARQPCRHHRPGIVLDPFIGSGTTALVSRRLGRHFLGCDLSEAYVKLCNARLAQAYTLPLFTDL